MELKDINNISKYQISSCGYIINKRTNRVIKPFRMPNGYSMVSLSHSGKVTTHYVHRLVAIHFIVNPRNKKTVNHKNGIKSDNRVENLEWATEKENISHAYKVGLVTKQTKVNQGAKLTNEIILSIRQGYITNKEAFVNIAKRYGVTSATIGNIINRKTWNHI